MFSKMDKSGTTRMPDPNLEVMSTKLNVSFPTLLSNSGSLKLGKPDSTWSNQNKKYVSINIY